MVKLSVFLQSSERKPQWTGDKEGGLPESRQVPGLKSRWKDSQAPPKGQISVLFGGL